MTTRWGSKTAVYAAFRDELMLSLPHQADADARVMRVLCVLSLPATGTDKFEKYSDVTKQI